MDNLPILNLVELKKLTDKKTGEIKTKYLKGHPRQYRFDASKGVVTIKGTIKVTGIGKPIKLIPISFRIFKERLFDYSKREWLELFFLNNSGAISSIMFHGYSVEHFMSMAEDLFYEDLKVTDIEITITPEKKKSKGTGNTFYIAGFEYKKAPAGYLEEMERITTGMMIYRSDTIMGTNDMIVSENYPDNLIEEQKGIEEKKDKNMETEKKD